MEFRSLGRTGVRVSPLCLGTLNFAGPTTESMAIRIIHKALDAGINFIDTANAYNNGESERVTGKALAGGRRERVILATKVFARMSKDPNDQGVSRRHILASVHDSLKRLQTSWIDLYQIHWPVFDVPQDETLRALDQLVREGSVRYIGCSNYPAWLVMEALALSERYGLARFISEQPPYNLLDRRIENELVPLLERYGMALLPWSPLAMGMLAGRYEHPDLLPENSRVDRIGGWAAERVTERALSVCRQVTKIARMRDLSPAQLALIWVKDQRAVTAPIIGPRNESHLDEALEVMNMHLDGETADQLDQLVPAGSVVSDFHNTHAWMKMKLL